MTKEFFQNRYIKHYDKIKEYASTGKLVDAQRTWARICELCEIAREIGTFNQQECKAYIKKAEECFYDNL